MSDQDRSTIHQLEARKAALEDEIKACKEVIAVMSDIDQNQLSKLGPQDAKIVNEANKNSKFNQQHSLTQLQANYSEVVRQLTKMKNPN